MGAVVGFMLVVDEVEVEALVEVEVDVGRDGGGDLAGVVGTVAEEERTVGVGEGLWL